MIAREYENMFEGNDAYFNALDQMSADSDFVCNTEELGQKLSENGNKVFRYFFNHQSSQNPWPAWSGVKHGDELEFTFGLPLTDRDSYPRKEIRFTRDVVKYWTKFVRRG